MDETMHNMKTIVKKKSFTYKPLANGDKEIIFGTSNTLVKLRKEQFMNLLDTFRGQTVTIGASRTNPPKGSLGEWLMNHITKTAIASYIVPILLMEGYASLVNPNEKGKIKFD
jgi:hypothetical protein